MSRTTGYWLADGIYPDWPMFVKTIAIPTNKKSSTFAKKQESTRKDVERAFGVLQSKWGIIKNPGRLWDVVSMSLIIKTCVILHNMNIEYNQAESTNTNPGEQTANINNIDEEIDHDILVSHDVNDLPEGTIAWLLNARTKIKNRNDYVTLQNDLINHIWEFEGTYS